VSSRNANAHLLPAPPPPNIPIPLSHHPSQSLLLSPLHHQDHSHYHFHPITTQTSSILIHPLISPPSLCLLHFILFRTWSRGRSSSITTTLPLFSSFFDDFNHSSHHLILISHLHVDFFGDPPKIPSVVVAVHVPTPLYPTIEVVFWGQTLGRCDRKEWHQW